MYTAHVVMKSLILVLNKCTFDVVLFLLKVVKYLYRVLKHDSNKCLKVPTLLT